MHHEGFLALGRQGRHPETGLGKNHARKWCICSGWGARVEFCSCMSGSMGTVRPADNHLPEQLRQSNMDEERSSNHKGGAL